MAASGAAENRHCRSRLSWVKRFDNTDTAEDAKLTPDEIGVKVCLRRLANLEAGFPNDEKFWRKRAPIVCHCSRYKIKKIWPEIQENFFEDSEGRIHHVRDYEERVTAEEKTATHSEHARNAANARWNKRPDGVVEMQSDTSNTGCSEHDSSICSTDAIRERESESSLSTTSSYIQESTREEEESVRDSEIQVALNPEILCDAPSIGVESPPRNPESQVAGLRKLWEAGGQPWGIKDEMAVRDYLSRPEVVQLNLCEYASWAFSSGRWREPTFTPKFWRYIASGDGERGVPTRTLPPPKPPRSATDLAHERAAVSFLAEQAALKRKATI